MYDRSTAFIRDWYRGPCLLNQSRTSESTRKEIGSLPAGSTTVAPSQKSGGRSLNSGGDVAVISRSDIFRNRVRSARPFGTGFALADRFLEDFAFTVITLASRNDPTFDFAAASSIGIDHGERNVLGLAHDDYSSLAVVPARVDALKE
jgi:hypothetical protein